MSSVTVTSFLRYLNKISRRNNLRLNGIFDETGVLSLGVNVKLYINCKVITDTQTQNLLSKTEESRSQRVPCYVPLCNADRPLQVPDRGFRGTM